MPEKFSSGANLCTGLRAVDTLLKAVVKPVCKNGLGQGNFDNLEILFILENS